MKKLISLILCFILIFPTFVFGEEVSEHYMPEYYIPIVTAAKNCGATVTVTHSQIDINHKGSKYLISAKTNTITTDKAKDAPLKKPLITKHNTIYAYYDDIKFLFENANELYKNTKKETVSLIYAYLYTNDIPGVTISIVDPDNNYKWTQGFGYSDFEGRVSVTGSTVFDIGSISKTFTALSVMKLVEEGIINLDEPVKTYIPEFNLKKHPVKGGDSSTVTVRMLLSHFSGVCQEVYSNFLSYDNYSKKHMNTLITTLNDQYMEALPGKRFLYSNAGYGVLGTLVSKVKGENRDYFTGFNNHATEMFKSLNMNSSGFVKTDLAKYNSAKPYIDGETGVQKYTYVNNLPAASAYSTGNDMATFMNFMLTKGKSSKKPYVKSTSIDEMIKEPAFSDKLNSFEKYGLGMEYSSHGIRSYVGHSGDIDYYKSSYKLSYENNVGAFISANSTSSENAINEIINTTLDKLIDEKTGTKNDFFFVNAKPPKDKFLSMDKLSKYLGIYLGIGEVGVTGKNEVIFKDLGTKFVQREEGGFGDDSFFVIYFDTIDGLEVMLGSAFGEKKVFSQKLNVSKADGKFYDEWIGTYFAVDENEHAFSIIEGITFEAYKNNPIIVVYPKNSNSVTKSYLEKIDDNKYYILGVGQGLGSVIEKKEINGETYFEYAGVKFKENGA